MPWRARDVRPTALCRRAGRPQLKRDPLGGSIVGGLLQPDADFQAFVRQLDAVLATYVTGAISFDGCVESLAELIRSRVPQPAQPLGSPLIVSSGTITGPNVSPVGQHFAGPDREKANAAFRAAFAKVFPFTEGAA